MEYSIRVFRYVIKRILMVLVIVLCVTLVMFVLLGSLTGSRIRMMPIYGGGDALDSVFTFLNAGDNLFTKYIRYIYNIVFHFNFGMSSTTGYRITRELDKYARITLLITACGAVSTYVIGIPIGVFAAVRKNRFGDRAVSVVLLFLSSLPIYAIALAVMLVLAAYLRIIPVMAIPRTMVSYIMPTITIALGGVSSVVQMTRANLLEVLDQPYITALQSKGLSERRVVYVHAFKNALIPTVSYLGGFLTQLLCGTFVVEHFFHLPGLGLYMLNSVSMRNHAEMLGCTVIISAVLATFNVVLDIIYAFIDPQTRLRYNKAFNAPQ